MRIRVLGQYLQGSLAILALAELAVLSFSMLAATLLRFRTSLPEIEVLVGPLWSRILLYNVVMIA